jgi:hypothetical protein
MVMDGERPSSGVWRKRWVALCVVWAGIWFVTGIFFWPFWIMVGVSLLAITLPVGKRR